MIQKVLGNCLKPIIQAEAQLRNRYLVSGILAVGASGMLVFILLSLYADWWSWSAVLGFFGLLAIFTIGGFIWSASRKPNLRDLAKRVEEEHPELRTALLTAMDQKPRADGTLGYLQSRVLGDVTEHAVKNRWVRRVSNKRLARASWAQFAALLAFCAAVWFLLGQAPHKNQTIAETVETDPKTPPPADIEIAVSPGDVEVEKGNRLIVEATFSGRAPSHATLVLLEKDEDRKERGRIPMQIGLDDNIFSALVASVDKDADYRIEFEAARSDEYSISTFEHPRLEKSDATITPPEYVKGDVRKIEDTRKVSLMEGSNLKWEIKINKPIAEGELFGEDESVIPLTASKSDPTVLVAAHEPDETQKYRLHLVDEKARANKRPPWFTVTVKRNLPPKLEFEFPKRDVEVSAIQELPVTATVWDDVEVVKAGITFQYEGKEKNLELASDAMKGGEHHPLETLFTLEDIGADPRDLITYHLWAEDYDKEGNVRRVSSDMFFAEVRHFEDIFRESSSQSGEGGQQGGGSAEKLLKLQKDVLNATWKLVRRKDMGRTAEELSEDVDVVRESQVIALSQTAAAMEEIEDPELKTFFKDAGSAMEKAIQNFELVMNDKNVDALQLAYNDAREAYEKLIQARAREHNITQSQNPSQGQPQEKEQQLMNLELKQKELKYQENTQAQEEQTAEQQENLEVLNKLKELARRQEAIAEKIKELEQALENAKGEEEKDEIKRQLKRLQEEQEELLRELDDLGEKMDSEENRANMSEAREQLEDIRENVREASEKLNEEQLADAANAATRAQRELEEATEDFREKTSRQFSEEMKSLRQNARDLAEAQKEITKQLEEDAQNTQSDPFSQPSRDENMRLAQALERQEERLENLIEEMKTLSEESEVSEPLLSDALYDSVRNTMVNGVDESLKETTRFMKYNRRDQAQQPAEAAERGIDELRAGVEKAAERILGSESDALRLARSELDDLIEQARSEEQRLAGENGEETDGEAKGEPGEKGMELASNERATEGEPGGSQERGEGTQEGQIEDPTGSDRPGEHPGEGEQPGGEKGKGGKEKGLTPGNGQQPGEEPGEGEKGASPGNGQKAGEEGEKGKGKGKGQGEGKGDQPGEQGQKGKGKGKGQGEGEGQQSAQEGQQPGSKGKGKGKGEGQGEPDGEEGEGRGQKGKGKGKGQGESEGQSQDGQQSQPGGSPSGGSQQRRLAGPNMGGDDRGGGLPTGGYSKATRPLFFNQEPKREEGPITGEDYKEWADRLGNLEEMLDEDDLRNEVAKVLDNARSMRIDFKRDNLPPQAANIQQKITDPLIELRDRISEELAKLNKENPISPIDRDPVPGEFRDLVRRYYEELGSGK